MASNSSSGPDLATLLQQLYRQFGELPGVHFELHQNLVAVYVRSAKAEARVFLQGAQVSHFQPQGQDPVLWLSEHNQYQVGKPLRGGIPISWPWFADLERNPQALQQQVQGDDPQAHGFCRNSDWQLDDIQIDDGDYALHFSWQPQSPAWPFQAKLAMVVTVSDALTLDITVTNTGTDAFNYTLALHTYFAVADIAQAKVADLAGADYLDCLQGWSQNRQAGPFTVAEEVDRVYQNVAPTLALEDVAGNRTIQLSSSQLPDLVTWNPWQAKAARLSQFGADDYQQMLCLENAALLDNLCYLPPGQNQRHGLKIQSLRQAIK